MAELRDIDGCVTALGATNVLTASDRQDGPVVDPGRYELEGSEIGRQVTRDRTVGRLDGAVKSSTRSKRISFGLRPFF